MRSSIIIVFLGIVLLSCETTKTNTHTGYIFKDDGTIVEPSGNRFRDIVAEKYSGTGLLIGGTTGSWAFDSLTGEILDREFSYVTPENDFKHTIVRADSSTWNWTPADAWIKHIADHHQLLRIHGPIGPQCAGWTRGDSVAVEQLEHEMKTYMKLLCERYNGVPGIVMLDVVNETVHEGDWKKNEPGFADWELPWFRIGQDSDSLKTPLYILYAFELATKYAPDMKLIYNQHENPEVTKSWDMIKQTIAYLRSRGCRVDGLGWQAHVDDGWATDENLDHLRKLIDWCFANNLSFNVTEAGVWMDTIQSTPETQANTYAELLKVIVEKHKQGEVSWNTWNLDDSHAWQEEKKPALFDENYQAKPAYYAIQKILEEGE